MKYKIKSLGCRASQRIIIYLLIFMAILTDVRWYLIVVLFLFFNIYNFITKFIVVLICISLMISDVEHLFIRLLAIICPLQRSVFQVLCPFFDWMFVILVLSFVSF